MGLVTAWDVRWLAECGSTMAEVRALARGGAPEGVVVAADHQTAGRGRLDRRWDAPPGASLLCSILLRPDAPSHRDTLGVAMAAADAVEHATAGVVRPGLKWPNDLLVDVPYVGERKLAGVLAEAERDEVGWAVVVGIGLNVGWPSRDDMPTELAGVVGALSHVLPPEDVPVRAAVLDSLLAHLGNRLTQSAPSLMAEFRERCVTLGRDIRVSVRRDDDALDLFGVASDVDSSGALVVVDRSGESHVLHAGDVVHVRPQLQAGPATGDGPGAN